MKKNNLFFVLGIIFSMSISTNSSFAQTAKKKSSKTKKATTEQASSDENTADTKSGQSEENNDRKESSPFRLTGTTSAGSHSYRSLSLTGRFQPDPVTALFAAVGFSSYESLKSQTFTLGVELRTSKELKLTVSGKYLIEPNEVRGAGGDARADYLLSSLWHGQFATELFGEFEWTRYWQKEVNRRVFYLNDPIHQFALTAGIAQQLTSLLDASIGYTQYLYSDDSQKLSQSVSQRSIANPHFSGLVSGFPKYGWNFDTSLHPDEKLDLTFFYSWLKLAVDHRTSQTYGGSVSVGIAPMLFLVGSLSQTKVQDAPEADWVYGLGLSARL